jgi:hypothetical protein
MQFIGIEFGVPEIFKIREVFAEIGKTRRA